MVVLVDAHTHLGSFPLFNVELDVNGMLSIMDEYNIRACIVFSLPNEITLNAVKKYSERLFGLVWVNPYDGERAVGEVEKYIEEYGFKGVKLHPLLDAFLP
ncbi:MAG TPA: amidohydrolase, partial [Candidatus Atribacteria bacterium]|nr:amidohydrolase [Candidatus Atribacteria bacterium]